jgi:hypothetical protein
VQFRGNDALKLNSSEPMFGVLDEGFGMVRQWLSFANLQRLSFDHLHCATFNDFPACSQGAHKALG